MKPHGSIARDSRQRRPATPTSCSSLASGRLFALLAPFSLRWCDLAVDYSRTPSSHRCVSSTAPSRDRPPCHAEAEAGRHPSRTRLGPRSGWACSGQATDAGPSSLATGAMQSPTGPGSHHRRSTKYDRAMEGRFTGLFHAKNRSHSTPYASSRTTNESPTGRNGSSLTPHLILLRGLALPGQGQNPGKASRGRASLYFWQYGCGTFISR